jgi:hypothetical protein
MYDLVGTRVWHPVQPPMRKRGDSKRERKGKEKKRRRKVAKKI